MWAFNAGRNTFDLHKAIIGLETLFWFSFEWPFKTGFTVFTVSIFAYLGLQMYNVIIGLIRKIPTLKPLYIGI